MGCILRNSHDDFLSCFASKRYGVLSVKEAEAGFKISAESDMTRPSRNRLGPNRVDTDTGYVGML